MFSQFRTGLTYANVVATIALFLALGGGAYAAVTLPKNSVKAKQIAKNAVGAVEIKPGAVRGSEVRNGSLLADDFAAGQLPRGEKGNQGDPGANGATNVTAHRSVAESVAPNSMSSFMTSECPAGERAVAGGIRFVSGPLAGDRVLNMLPTNALGNVVADGATPNGWGGRIFNSDAVNARDADVHVVCAPP